MCGIAGVLLAEPSDPSAVIARQLALLNHRGPDSHGWYSHDRGGVGQTRLAIIDLETGDPPILDEDGSIGVVLNGEIYNFQQLRTELTARGHDLRSTGDTEVIAHLAEQLEPRELASRLDGMFAFAVWDGRRDRLVLGRDRLGKKPLYYAVTADAFVFGSEIKAVLASDSVSRRLNEDAIPAYLTFGYVPTPATFFAGVLSVPPGHVLTVRKDLRIEVEEYWRPPRANGRGQHRRSLRDAARQTRTMLEAAVERRLVADVPLGAFLSGGIDSSAIVAIMAHATDRPVKTFTIGFVDGDGFDERPYARAVASRYATEHTEFVVAPDALDLVDQLVWHHDQPFGDSSAVPTYLLNQLTRGHVTVALSGDGGDELFGGYERFWAALALQRYRSVPQPVRAASERLLQQLPRRGVRGRVGSLQRFVRHASLPTLDAYRSWLSFFDEAERCHLLQRPSNWALVNYEHIWRETEGARLLDRLIDLNLRTYLLDDLLVKADRMSMAHGLEVRSPFLDTELVEFAAGLPARTKIAGTTLKRVLKHAVSDLLPDSILNRRKRGFGVPLDRWFREDLDTLVRDRLGSPSARLRAHVDGAVVDRMLGEHRSGERDRGQQLWLLLTLELFLRREGW